MYIHTLCIIPPHAFRWNIILSYCVPLTTTRKRLGVIHGVERGQGYLRFGFLDD